VQALAEQSPPSHRNLVAPVNGGNGAGRAVPNAKLRDREESNLAVPSGACERPELAHWGNLVVVGPASRCVNYSIGGSVKPPNSRSIMPANAIVARSFR
jgi:hypothetical protein